MKKQILISTVIAILTAVPALSFAATYQYVNTNGNVSTVSADSAAQAMTVSDIAPTSGVIQITSGTSLNFTNFVPVSGTNTYQYVNTSGNVSTVNANSAAQAMTVSDIAPTSGVIQIAGTN